MPLFERDPELLAFASLNPSIFESVTRSQGDQLFDFLELAI